MWKVCSVSCSVERMIEKKRHLFGDKAAFSTRLEISWKKVLIAEVEKSNESTKLVVQIRRGMKHQSDFAVLHDIRRQ